MKVLIIDDHEYTREGITRILADNFSITKVGQGANYEDAMGQIKDYIWDLIILDINLPGRSGLDVITSIREIATTVPILVLSMVPVSQYIRRILQAGATGYLTKSEPAEEFLKAIHALTNGRKYFSPEVQQELPDLIDESIERKKHYGLTNREFEILLKIAEGKSPKEIAGEYKLAINTVNSYRRRVLAKLHVRTNLDLVRYAFQHGIVK